VFCDTVDLLTKSELINGDRIRGTNITGNLIVDKGVESLSVRYPHNCLDCVQTYIVSQSGLTSLALVSASVLLSLVISTLHRHYMTYLYKLLIR